MTGFVFLPGRFDSKMFLWALEGQLIIVNIKKLIPYKHLYACCRITAAYREEGGLVTQNSFCLCICVHNVYYFTEWQTLEFHMPIPQQHAIAKCQFHTYKNLNLAGINAINEEKSDIIPILSLDGKKPCTLLLSLLDSFLRIKMSLG